MLPQAKKVKYSFLVAIEPFFKKNVFKSKLRIMKKLFPSIVAIAIISLQAFAQPVNNQSVRKVQVAILFDTSNSMDGLIDQAKTRIWSIINELSLLRLLV